MPATYASVNDFFTEKFGNLPNQHAIAHFMSYKSLVEYMEMTPADAIKFFPVSLKGEPLVWFNTHKAALSTLAIIEKEFKSMYTTTVSREEYLKRFKAIALETSEDLTKYRNRVTNLAAKSQIVDQELIKFHFIDGLPSHIRPALRAIKK